MLYASTPFLSPSVVDFTLLVTSHAIEGNMIPLDNVLDLLSSCLPSVVHLRIDGDEILRDRARSIATFCTSFHNLESVVLSPSAISVGLLRWMSEECPIKCLRFAEFASKDAIRAIHDPYAGLHEHITDFPLDSFSRCSVFSFIASTCAIASSLILSPNFPSRLIKHLWIRITDAAFLEPEHVFEMMAVIAASCTSLEGLTLRTAAFYSREVENMNINKSLEFKHFSSFLDMPLLTAFTIDHSFPLAITSKDVFVISCKASRFKVLWLNPYPLFVPTQSLVKMVGMSCLMDMAKRCGSLESLAMCMDLTEGVPDIPCRHRFVRLLEFFVGWTGLPRYGIDPECRTKWESIASMMAELFSTHTVITTLRDHREVKEYDMVSSRIRKVFVEEYGHVNRSHEAWMNILGMAEMLRSYKVLQRCSPALSIASDSSVESFHGSASIL